jgi:hypothetical protein
MLITVKRTDKATERRMEIAREADDVVIQFMKENPASTIYEIAKALGWTTGKIQGSISRLKIRLGDKLTVENDISTGRLKKKYDIKE